MIEYKVDQSKKRGFGITRGEVIDSAINQLQKKVNLSIKEGWLPTGGISIVIDESYYCVASQAMTKSPN